MDPKPTTSTATDPDSTLAPPFPADLIEHLRRARRVVILTGAGASAESGVPTFQGGFWAQYKPEDLATPEGFRRNPQLVWNWYAARREMITRLEPNAGHYALAELEKRVPECTLVTQNIDGLHQRAGNHRVFELHGNLGRIICSRERIVVDQWQDGDEIPPRCPHCGALLRPDVVWFGEMLPEVALAAATAASQECDLFFSVGTAGLVYPAASLAYEALDRGATVVEVNPEKTPLTPKVTYAFQRPSGQVLPALLRAVWA